MNGPYKGLAAFEDQDLDALLFFGRDQERETVIANLMASRLTILYGASGVGKSSLLRAGVVHELRQTARETGERRGAPEAAVVLFGSWATDPVRGLIEAVADSLEGGLLEGEAARNGPGSLVRALAAASRAVDGDVYVVLDQFEEYFVYHPDTEHDSFATELAEAVRTEGLRANFLVSLRDDALAELDRFAGKLPGLLANTIRVEHLDLQAGRDAIVEPPRRYAALEGEPELQVEESLVAAVLDEVATGRVSIGEAGVGVAETASDVSRIEAPYLQLVMERLWAAEIEAGSGLLRLETLRGLGGSRRIVEAHFDDAMSGLAPEEQEIAARIFGHLVTPSGTKIAHAPPDLAQYAGVEEEGLEPVLSSLAKARILRPSAAAGGETRYEIFHDVLAQPVLGWKRRYESERRLEAERTAAAKRQRRLVAVAAVALTMLAAMVGVTVFALTQRSEAREQASVAHSRELAAGAVSELASDPELGLLLALEAARTRDTPEAESALRQSLLATRAERVLRHGGEPVQTAAVLAGGEVASVAADGVLRRFDGASGRILAEVGGEAPSVAAAFDLTGEHVAVAAPSGLVSILDVLSGETVATVDHGGPVTGLSFGGDGELLVTAGREGGARVWQSTTGEAVAEITGAAALTSAAVNPAGTLVATAGRDGVTRLWATPEGELIREITGHRGVVADVAFSPDGALLVTAGTDGLARVVDVASGGLVATLVGHANALTTASFSPDGQWVLTTSRDHGARIWELETGRLAAPLLGHGDAVAAGAFDPAGETLVTASADGTARIWSTTVDQALSTLTQGSEPVVGAYYTEDGSAVVMGEENGALLVVDAATGSMLASLEGGSPIETLERAGAREVVTAAGTEAVVHDLDGSAPTRSYDHGGRVTAAAASPDGSAVASAGEDGVARVFSTETGEVELELQGHAGPLTDVAFSPDGSLLATAGSDRTARIWNSESGAVELELSGHRDDVASVEFSPDGRFVVTASRDHDARIFEVATRRLVHVLNGHFGAVADASFSPDGRWIVTAGQTPSRIMGGREREVPVLPPWSRRDADERLVRAGQPPDRHSKRGRDGADVRV